MSPSADLIRWVCDPTSLLVLDRRGWERALMLGRRHGISGRWLPELSALEQMDRVPPAASKQLRSDYLLAAERTRSAQWETGRLRYALRDTGIEPILLKGAAYIAAGLRPGFCRMLTDVDFLVPFPALASVEEAVTAHGWRPTQQDHYDDRYYREWMHELPPYQHSVRGSTLDIHHNILPRTSDLCPDAAVLIERSRTVADGCTVLAPADMVMHSVFHGFYSGELGNCFRDVLDVYELCRDFQKMESGFWDTLAARALELRAAKPLWLALSQSRRFPGPGVPATVMRELESAAAFWPARRVVEWAIGTVLLPAAPPTRLERLALRGLLARSHWCKMPLRILVPHLSHKLNLRIRDRFRKPVAAES